MLSGIVLGILLLGAGPKEPAALRGVPVELTSRATVVVSGKFVTSRGPCELLPNGSRRWALLQGFMTKAVYRGDVRADYIGAQRPRLWSENGRGGELDPEREYLLLIRPSKRTSERLKEREGSRRYQDALGPDELIAVVAP